MGRVLSARHAVAVIPLLALWGCCVAAAPPPPAAATVLLRTASTPAARTAPAFLGVNIDAASLYQDTRLNFSDPNLRALARRLGGAADARMTLRVGGSAADDLGVGAGTAQRIALDLPYWDALAGFAADAQLDLAFDLNAMRMRTGAGGPGHGPWNDSDARALLTHAHARGQAVWALQLGNEPGHFETRGGNVTAAEHGADFVALRRLVDEIYGNSSKQLQAPPPPRIQGPDVCFGSLTDTSPCASMEYLREFLAAAEGAVDDLTVHTYGLMGPKNNASRECVLPSLLQPALWEVAMSPVLSAWARLHAASANGTHLVLSEFATAGDGGCPGMSNAFAAGFFFVDAIGRVAKHGFWQAYRQDLVGFSGIEFGSSYALAGDPGWFDRTASGPLSPNPDFFTALLWRALVGDTLFSSELMPSPGEKPAAAVTAAAVTTVPEALRIHAGCTAASDTARAAGATAASGAVTVAFANPSATGVNLSVAFEGGSNATVAAAFVLSAPEGNLTSRHVLLNGGPAPLDADSALAPATHAVAPGAAPSLLLPAHSYGFLVLPDAGVQACRGGS